MTIKETSAYIKGLIEGANLDTTTPEGKVIAALADLCGKMAAEILLNGKTPADIEIATLTPDVVYNEELCAQLGIEVPAN